MKYFITIGILVLFAFPVRAIDYDYLFTGYVVKFDMVEDIAPAQFNIFIDFGNNYNCKRYFGLYPKYSPSESASALDNCMNNKRIITKLLDKTTVIVLGFEGPDNLFHPTTSLRVEPIKNTPQSMAPRITPAAAYTMGKIHRNLNKIGDGFFR